jgi:hypothetical protein
MNASTIKGRWFSTTKSVCGLNQSVLDVERAGGAVLFSLFNPRKELKPFWFAVSLLELFDGIRSDF